MAENTNQNCRKSRSLASHQWRWTFFRFAEMPFATGHVHPPWHWTATNAHLAECQCATWFGHVDVYVNINGDTWPKKHQCQMCVCPETGYSSKSDNLPCWNFVSESSDKPNS